MNLFHGRSFRPHSYRGQPSTHGLRETQTNKHRQHQTNNDNLFSSFSPLMRNVCWVSVQHFNLTVVLRLGK